MPISADTFVWLQQDSDEDQILATSTGLAIPFKELNDPPDASMDLLPSPHG